MRSLIRKVSFKKYCIYVGSVLPITAILMFCGEFYFEPLDGGLTRLGALPERDFGWEMPQPLIQVRNLYSYPIAEADVLIIGDSFSGSLVWQSQLVHGGIKPSTLHWNDVNLCVDDIGEVVRQSGFRGRYVVIETVERTLQLRMSSRCKKGSRIRKSGEYSSSAPPTNQSKSFLMNSRLGAKWVLEAMANKFRYTYQPSSYMEFGNARMVSTRNGCGLFTNRLCNYGLYYSDDFNKGTFNSINNILLINRSLKKENIQTIWLVVPDKSTIYLGYGVFNTNPYINIWKALHENGELEVPNLDERFIQESRRIKDFYAPNDTHLSTNGYLFLGGLMSGYIKNAQQAELIAGK